MNNKNSFKISKSNVILLAVLLVGIISGLVSAWDYNGLDWRSILGNLSSELIGAVLLYFILEKIIHKTEQINQLKDKLLIQMESSDNSTARDAINQLKKEKWLQDGSLNGRFFNGANLQEAFLTNADLKNVGFYRCDLTNAHIYLSQLINLSDLRMTTMPDGNLYDGRFKLIGDLDWARIKYDVDGSDVSFAKYYGVSLSEYQAGQRWADENLTTIKESNENVEHPLLLSKSSSKQTDS